MVRDKPEATNVASFFVKKDLTSGENSCIITGWGEGYEPAGPLRGDLGITCG